MRKLFALLNTRINPWLLGSVLAIALATFLLFAYRDLENRMRILASVDQSSPVRVEVAEALRQKRGPAAGPRAVKGNIKAMHVEGDGRIVVQLHGYLGEDIRLTLTPLEIGETKTRWACSAAGVSRSATPDVCREPRQ